MATRATGPTRAKRATPRSSALPRTTNAVDMAMAEVAADPAPDNPARALLANQNELVRAEIARLARLRWRDYIVTGFGVLLLAVAALFVWAAVSSRAVVVNVFETPPSLAERGVTGQVLAGSIQDAIATIQAFNADAAMERNIDNAWTNDVAVDVPTTGVSVGELDRLLRQRLGRETYVGGSVVSGPDGTLVLTIRATGVPPRVFVGADADLPQLTTQAAEYVYGMFEPRLFARYLINQNRLEDALAFVELAYARSPDAFRSSLVSSWATALSLSGQAEESAAKNRLAIELDPENWIAAGNLVATLYDIEGEEGAVREGKRLEARIAAARPRPPVSTNYLQNYQPLVEDWTGYIDAHLAAMEANEGRSGLSGDTNLYLADAEASRHDWNAADRHLLAGASDKTQLRASQLLIRGLKALEARNVPAAVEAFEEFKVVWDANPGLQWGLYYQPCYLGLAYGLAGRAAEANAIFDATGDWTYCAVFRADVIEASGDRAAADAAYAAAIRLSPSLPSPYQGRGVALLARGDMEGAKADFAAAHARGPRWADPLKSLGDIAMRERRWKDAAGLYKRASTFAPGWVELAAARRRADARVAALPWWKR